MKIWIYPFEEDIQYADKDQIANCKIGDTCDISDSRNTTYLKGMIFSNYFKSILETSVSVCPKTCMIT